MHEVVNREQQFIHDRVDIDSVTGCWLWNKHLDHNGYGQSGRGRLYKKYGTELTHKLSYLLFKGEVPDGFLVRHECRNRHCCNPAHLDIGTAQNNSDDKHRDGTYRIGFVRPEQTGSKNPEAKLNEQMVLEIRRLFETGSYTKNALARMFDVSHATIGNVVRRKLWTHI